MKSNFGYSWRAYLIYIFLAISLLILVFRIISLKYVEGDFLTSKGKSMLETSRSIPAIRGSILDRNNFQQTGSGMEILDLDSLNEKWRSFNWEVVEIDGHNYSDIFNALTKKTLKPKIIIANTKKGKGFSFSEDNNDWHHKILTKNQYEEALKELDK